MTREEALEAQSKSKPCKYIGRFGYLQDKQWYIKKVKKRAVIVSSTLVSPDWNDYHEIQLDQLALTA